MTLYVDSGDKSIKMYSQSRKCILKTYRDEYNKNNIIILFHRLFYFVYLKTNIILFYIILFLYILHTVNKINENFQYFK